MRIVPCVPGGRVPSRWTCSPPSPRAQCCPPAPPCPAAPAAGSPRRPSCPWPPPADHSPPQGSKQVRSVGIKMSRDAPETDLPDIRLLREPVAGYQIIGFNSLVLLYYFWSNVRELTLKLFLSSGPNCAGPACSNRSCPLLSRKRTCFGGESTATTNMLWVRYNN